MQLRRYQWAGLYAGLILFSGSWLTAYFNNWLVSFVTMLLFGAALYAAVRVERRALIPDHIKYGATAGLLAGLVARLVGFIATRWAFGSPMIQPNANYGLISGFFANTLNGGLTGTVIMVLMSTILGASVAFFEPEEQKAHSRRAEVESDNRTKQKSSSRRRRGGR
jgi:hypothetical protein